MKTRMAKQTTVIGRRIIRHNSKGWLLVLGVFFGAWLLACGTDPSTSPSRQLNGVRTLALPPITKGDGMEATRAQAKVFKGACDINASVEAFRSALGTLNPSQPGSFGSGRREINWDAVPAQFTNVDNFPADFFNQPVFPRARGAVFATPGSGFRVSDNNFKDLNLTYADEFNFFSPIRTFIAVGSNVSSVQFFVPGSATPATSTGFGVVFSDVDHLGSAMIRLFDASGRSLGTYLAPACPEGFSFVGVKFPDAIVAKVDIVSGR